MIEFSPCKINLGLRVLHKRADGFHELATVFYPIPLFDVLELVNGNTKNEGAEILMHGLIVPGDPNNNLIVKAYHLLATKFNLKPVTFALLKNTPMGAGLGGGSSNGAYAIRLLNQHFGLNLSLDEQIQFAAQLGSDCAFFIHHSACIGSGRGELLQAIDFSLKGYWIALVKPDIHVSTADAFKGLTLDEGKLSALPEDIIKMPIETWKNTLVNDFESSVFKLHPVLDQIKNNLYEKGALYAAMSGSGSTVFGLFKEKPDLSSSFQAHYYKELLLP